MYFHMPREKRNKLEASGKKGIFVGYSENSKAYKIYVPGQRDVEVSRDATLIKTLPSRKLEISPSQGRTMMMLLKNKNNLKWMSLCPMLTTRWILLFHLLEISLPQGKDLYGSRIHFKTLKSIPLQEGHFVKVRSRTSIKSTLLP